MRRFLLKVEQVLLGAQGGQVSPQGDRIPNVEGGNEVPVVHSDLTNQEI